MGHEHSHSATQSSATQSNSDADGADASAPFFVVEQFHAAGQMAPGSTVGRYQIIREIGVGGMGIVYEAMREDLQRPVALKTLLSNARLEHTERLHREAETLARLDHAGISSVIDVFTEGNRFWIVMELVEGRRITEASKDLALRDKLKMFLDVCRAVEHAHLRGVVHRDLKPGNIHVTTDGRPIVLDFGLARLVEDAADHRVTQTGQLVGTLPYMSPEQASGDDQVIDVRSDVYSLGVLLYEMLTNELPIDVPTGSLVRAARAIEHVPPVTPSQRIPALKGDLDQILLKALAKSPSQRYASVAAMAQDIERHLEHRPIEARPPTALYRTTRYMRRHRALVFGSGATILALAVGLVLAMTQVVRARAAEQRATTRFNDVRELAHTVIFDLHDAIKDLSGGTAARAILVESAMEYLNRLEREVDAQPAFRIELARGYVRLGDALGGYFGSHLMRYEEGWDAFGRAIAMLEPLEAADQLDIDGLRLLRDAFRGRRMTRPVFELDLTPSPFGDIPQPTYRWWEVSDRILKSPLARDSDRAAHCVVKTHVAMELNRMDAEFSDVLAAFDAAEAVLDSMSEHGRLTAEALSAEGEMRQRRASILFRRDEVDDAARQFELALNALSEARALAPEDRYISRMLGFACAEGAIAYGILGDRRAEELAMDGLKIIQKTSEADPTDSWALRNLDTALYMTAEGLYLLAVNDVAASQEERQVWLTESLRRFERSWRLVQDRETRGQLPRWESHYPSSAEEAVQRAKDALAANQDEMF